MCNFFLIVFASSAFLILHTYLLYPLFMMLFFSKSKSKRDEYDENDIIVFASDDFLAPQNWDEYLINQLAGKQGGLFVRDGYQLPDSSNMLHPAITIPIMTGGCLTALNKAIYHPAYSHMFSDCELYLNLKELNMLIDNRLTDMTTFEHHHYVTGKRQQDQADVAYSKNWAMDQINWNVRKDMTLEERLRVN